MALDVVVSSPVTASSSRCRESSGALSGSTGEEPDTPLTRTSSTSSIFDDLRSSDSERAQALSSGKVLELVWPLFLIAALEIACASTRDTVYFPFLRTLIECENATASDFDRSSGDWSGSKHCDNRCLVAEEAQMLRGYAVSWIQPLAL